MFINISNYSARRKGLITKQYFFYWKLNMLSPFNMLKNDKTKIDSLSSPLK